MVRKGWSAMDVPSGWSAPGAKATVSKMAAAKRNAVTESLGNAMEHQDFNKS